MSREQAASDNFTIITETPGIGASREQLSMLYARYRFAAEFCRGKDVLEIACGAGQGLGYLAKTARRVVGGDIDEQNLSFALRQYKDRSNLEVQKLDAHELPFPDKRFDVILLYEAIYYLRDPERFLVECRRVLRDGGTLLLCSVNREWPDFNPSPFSVRYFSAAELASLLQKHRFCTELFGGFPVNNNSVKKRVVSLIKRTAVSLRLIPKTMKGKQLLKRIFLGKLSPLPSEVYDGMADYVPPTPIAPGSPHPVYKVIYVKGSVN